MSEQNVWTKDEIESAKYQMPTGPSVYRCGCPKCGVSYMSLVPQATDNGPCETCDKIAQERQRCARVVRSFQIDAGYQYTQTDVDEQKEQLAKEIERGE